MTSRSPANLKPRDRQLIRRHGHGDPLLDWRLHTCRLKFEPLPPGHAWNLPETIQPNAGG